MTEINKALTTRLVYLIGCANSTLNCGEDVIKHVLFDGDYCEIDYYKRKDGSCSCERILDFEIGGAKLSCCINDYGMCNCCLVYLDKTDDADAYIELCNSLFKFDAANDLWTLHRSCMQYKETEKYRYFVFAALGG